MSVAIVPPSVGRYSLRSLPTPLLVRQLDALAAQELATDADVLAHLAELDVREEYLRLGFASLQDYCVRRLRMSEDRANKRIRVCRTALAYPVIFEMIADGRLNLGGVAVLSAHLTESNAADLLVEAANLTRVDMEFMLARRFPRVGATADAPTLELTCGIAGDSEVEVAPGPLPVPTESANSANAMGPVREASVAPTAKPTPSFHARFTPLSGECVALRGQLSMAAYEHFQRVRALASHAIPSGNAALVIEYALKLAAAMLDKRKFGRGTRTRPRDGQPAGRYIPAAVRQEVCERHGGRCAYVGLDGTRCGSEWHLEFDHIVPLAEGGQTVASNLRPLCRRHNQLEAKRRLGADLITARTEQARAEAVRTRQRKEKQMAKAPTTTTPTHEALNAASATSAGNVPSAPSSPDAPNTTTDSGSLSTAPRAAVEADRIEADRIEADRIEADIVAALRTLKMSLAEAKRGVAITAHMIGATAEQRVRAALQQLGRAPAHRVSFG